MAGTRLYRFGTIFSRVTSLLKTEVIKEAEKPLWYDVMAAFPPKIEPKYDRFVDTTPVPEILYEEDNMRVKYYDTFGYTDIMDLSKVGEKYSCQKFIDRVKDLQSTNPELTDDRAFEAVAEEFQLKKPETQVEIK